jgi:hypothetical protein
MAFAPVVYSQFYLNELPWQFIEGTPVLVQFWSAVEECGGGI